MDKVTDLKHNEYPSIYRKIRWGGFGVMTFVMFTLFWSLIYVAENKLEVLSLHHWLDTEAALYSENFEKQAGMRHCQTYWSSTHIGVKLRHRIGCSLLLHLVFTNTCLVKKINTLLY